MLKVQQPPKVSFRMIKHKTVRLIIKEIHELFTLINNGLSLTPCKYSNEQSGNFNILPQIELVWNTNGIALNKIRMIELVVVLFQNSPKV